MFMTAHSTHERRPNTTPFGGIFTPACFMENDVPPETLDWPQKGTKGAKTKRCIFLRDYPKRIKLWHVLPKTEPP
jgi:hypothetical protein